MQLEISTGRWAGDRKCKRVNLTKWSILNEFSLENESVTCHFISNVTGYCRSRPVAYGHPIVRDLYLFINNYRIRSRLNFVRLYRRCTLTTIVISRRVKTLTSLVDNCLLFFFSQDAIEKIKYLLKKYLFIKLAFYLSDFT